MELITIIKNEKFTGTQYSKSQFDKNVADFHRSQGESWILKEPFDLTEEQLENGDFGSPTEEELAEQAKQEIYSRLAKIDKEAVRPTRAIKVAELQNKEPSQFDVDKLIELENEASELREQLKGL